MDAELRRAIERGNFRAARRLLVALPKRQQNELRTELTQLAARATKRNAKPIATTLAKLLGDAGLFRYSDDGMDWIELAAAVIAALAHVPPRVRTGVLLEQILAKVPRTAKYAPADPELSFSLAKYFAMRGDRKLALEYVRRARYGLEAERYKDACFSNLRRDPELADAVRNIDYTYGIWWKRLWPIDVWYDPAKHSGEI